MRAWILIAIALASTPFGWAARPARTADIAIPQAKLDAYFDALEKHGLANGAIAISQKGVPRYQRSLGFTELDASGKGSDATRTDEGARYRIGPVSELFTAALTMQLIESASIGLDSKLAEFFPELPNALEITYRDLLQHRSGLTSFAPLAPAPGTPYSRADLLKLIENTPVRFAPRERIEHSEANYLLLSYILEKVQERPYAEVLRRQIADKLGLARTYYGGRGRRSGLESVSYSFTGMGWTRVPETDPDLLLGAGGIVSAPGDLLRFIDALFAAKVVTAQSLATMLGGEGVPDMGLRPWIVANRTGYARAGHLDGYAAWVYHSPETGVSIAFASNATLLPMEEIVDEVLALLHERGRKPPTFEPVELTTEQMREYVGLWVAAPKPAGQLPFREIQPAPAPREVTISIQGDHLIARSDSEELRLLAFGDGEFLMAGTNTFWRFHGREDGAVARTPESAVYFKRAR